MESTKNRGGRAAVLIAVIVMASGGWWWLHGRGGKSDAAGPTTTERSAPAGFAADPEAPDPSQPPGSITGVVTDADGRPVVAAKVFLARARSRNSPMNVAMRDFGKVLQVATSGADGQFRLDRVAAGLYAVSAMAKGHAPATAGPFDVQPREEKRTDLRLGKGALRLSGHVQDIGGGPVPNAKVTLFESTRVAGDAPRGFEAVADESGAYEMYLTSAQYMLTGRADGYAPSSAWFTLIADTVRDLRLSPAARISGRVLNRATKTPIPDAELWLIVDRAMRGRPRDAKADAEGRYAFTDLEPGTYRVGARHGALIGRSAGVSLPLAGAVSDVEVLVDRGQTVTGKVLTAAGAPLPNANVMLIKDRPPWEQPRSARSEADGRFRIEGVMPAEYRFEVSAEGLARARQALQVVGDVNDLVVKLAKGATVKAQVLTEAGKSAAGATVEMRVMSRDPMGSAGDNKVAGADGRVVFEGLPTGRLMMAATDKRLGIATLPEAMLAETEEKTVTLTLRSGSVVSGTVKFDDGRPAVGARVEGMSRTGSGRLNAIVAADGSYRLEQVPPGQLTVTASLEQNITWGGDNRPDQKEVTVGESQSHAGVDLVIAGALSITGIVVGPDGKPVASAEVSAAIERNGRAFRGYPNGQAYTDPDGAFTIDRLGSGKYTVWATQPGFSGGDQVGIAGGSTGVRLQLAQETTIAGTVVGADGRPMPNYTIALAPGPKPNETVIEKRDRQFASSWDLPSDTVSDPSGKFFITHVSAGNHELRVRTAGGASAAQPITVGAGEKKTGVQIVVMAGGRIVGRIVDVADARPLANVEVRAMFPGGMGVRPTVKTDSSGAFALEGASIGETGFLTFDSRGEKYLSERRRIEVAKPGDVDLGTIAMTAGDVEARTKDGTWSGRVGINVGEDGTPRVASVRPGSAAERGGIKEGDVILSVDGRSTRGMGTGAFEYHLNGKPDTQVTLVVQSPNAGSRTVALTRESRGGPPAPTAPASASSSGAAASPSFPGVRPAGGAVPSPSAVTPAAATSAR